MRLVRGALLAALAAFSAWLVLHYGPLGLNPVDQPIVFDGGWRILSGQLPFRDFTTPVGITPSVLQALFFAVGRVGWSTYVAHAAVVNALFALTAFAVMRRLGSGFLPALLVGIGSGVVFYPAFGVPYMDQHSFFFSLCCLWATLIVIETDGRSALALIGVTLFAAAALLSKIVPAAFIAGPCLLAAGYAGFRRRPASTAAAFLLPVVAAAAYLAAIHARLHDVVEYTFDLPFHTASARTVLYPTQATAASFAARVGYIWREWYWLLPYSKPLVTGLWIGAVAAILAARRLRKHSAGRAIALLAVSIWLGATTAVFTYITNNAASNALGLLPLIIGTGWLAADKALGLFQASGRYDARRFAAFRMTIAVVTLALAAVDVWQFNETVTAARALNGFDSTRPRWSVDGPMHGLVMHDNAYLFDIRDIIPYVEQRPDNFLVFGDSIWLYGATRHPSVFPALWYHPGLTIPPSGTADFEAFDRRAVENLRRFGARYIIQEGSGTRMGARLGDFPALSATVDGCPEAAVGGWTIREICHLP